MEAGISRVMVQFEKEHMGRGPENVRTQIFEDVVFVRLSGVLTPAERHLAREQDGAGLIKGMLLCLGEPEGYSSKPLVITSEGGMSMSLMRHHMPVTRGLFYGFGGFCVLALAIAGWFWWLLQGTADWPEWESSDITW